MRVGIDGSNLRDGGGVTHLREILRAVRPEEHGVSKVVLWAGRKTLDLIPNRPFLSKEYLPVLDGSLIDRLFWQKRDLSRLARERCDVLFVPGGLFLGNFRPILTMSRNLLPFESAEMIRYGLSRQLVRNSLLRLGQARTYRRADAMIFLTNYALQAVSRVTGPLRSAIEVIPHGVNEAFRRAPRPQRSLAECSLDDPFRLLYVSIIDVYKHQWNVVEAVASLRRKGYPVVLDLVGRAYPPALAKLRQVLDRIDPAREFIRYTGFVAYDELPCSYHAADAFIFASSCENMPNILLEAMAAGLPIASSDRGPMPEMLGDGGVYFDPEKVTDIESAISRLSADAALREQCARVAFARAMDYSWERCARSTFDFLARIARKGGKPAGRLSDSEGVNAC